MGVLFVILGDSWIDGAIKILLLAFLAYNIFSMVFVSFLYLIAMKHFQNHEYHKHKKGIITLASAITVSMFASFIMLYRVYVNDIADFTNKKFEVQQDKEIFVIHVNGNDNNTLTDLVQ